ncbi:ATP-binding cassette domain-containing protein, partial [Streptomyces sparsus]
MSAEVAPPENDVLVARELHYSHGDSPALVGVSLDLRVGEIIEVTGPRGSGKSTLLGCLSGRLLPNSGEVRFDGVPLHTLPPGARDRLRRERFGWVGSTPGLLPELTAWENAALPLLLA